ncbi:MAG: hypothetical protein R6T92_11025, partial [Desulfosalsimonadaceae bacterium]
MAVVLMIMVLLSLGGMSAIHLSQRRQIQAAVVGRDLNDARYDEIPPVHLLGGSGLVRGVVRAKEGESDAPV